MASPDAPGSTCRSCWTSFDTIISRFGVMFFDDAVRAFANLRRAAANDARLRFIAWIDAHVSHAQSGNSVCSRLRSTC